MDREWDLSKVFGRPCERRQTQGCWRRLNVEPICTFPPSPQIAPLCTAEVHTPAPTWSALPLPPPHHHLPAVPTSTQVAACWYPLSRTIVRCSTRASSRLRSLSSFSDGRVHAFGRCRGAVPAKSGVPVPEVEAEAAASVPEAASEEGAARRAWMAARRRARSSSADILSGQTIQVKRG